MRHRRILGSLAAGVVALTLALPAPALAAGPGPGGGGGGGGGTGGGGTGGGETGGGEPTDTTGSLYSDLVIALRAENGTPILKKYDVPATETEPATTEYCVQPVSYEQVPGLAMSSNPVDGRSVWVIPLQGEWIGDPASPVAQDEIGPCDPQPQYVMFVNEVELERLNLARTSEDVITGKIADVQTKLRYADRITLGPTGRLSYDGTEIDASPENAGMYRSLMTSGTIPGLHPENMVDGIANVGPTPQDGTSNSQFDAWELAAMTLGAAASKSTPFTIDTAEYYNRIIGFPPLADPTATPPVPDYTSPWGMTFVRSTDPANAGTELAGSERFVNYNNFSYNRSQTFKGSVTWLDVASLEWKVSKITDVVPFTNLSSYDEIGDKTLHGVTAFAQLADDVRAMCNYVPDNTFIPGFYMDVPGVDTNAEQLKAIHDPAVDIGMLPAEVFKTQPFQVTASLLNPWGGDPIPDARLRLTFDAPDASDALADGDITAAAVGPAGVPITFVPDGNGDLIGWWVPNSGLTVPPGYNVSTTFDVTIGPDAPAGSYALTLDLVSASDALLASESGTLTVNDNVATVLWAGSMVKYATQASSVKIPLQVYAPAADTPGHLTLTIQGPGDDPLTTTVVEALASGDLKVYGDAGTSMVAMPLTLVAPDTLQGTWDATFPAGYTPVNWYASVRDGAPVGNYAFTIDLAESNTLGPVLVAFEAVESHGQQPPGAGDDTTAPVATLTASDIAGASASFTFTADDTEATFECMLTTDGIEGVWETCTSPKTYTALEPGTYVFSVRAKDKAGNISVVKTSQQWTVDETPPSDDTTPPTVTIIPDGTPGSTAKFTFTANEQATFQCQLTKGDQVMEAWAGCTSPKQYTGLASGTYVFSVRATDAAGNPSQVATHEWSVTGVPSGGGTGAGGGGDVTAPAVKIAVVDTSGSTASFNLATETAEPGVTFDCRLTRNGVAGPWVDCPTSPTGEVSFTDLEPASYVLSVTATDASGNVSDVASTSWVVPVTAQQGAPSTEILAGPAQNSWVLARTARYQLGSDTEGAQFRVRVNDRKAQSCDAASCVVTLDEGRNRIRFAARMGENADQTPAVRTVFVPQGVTGLRMSAGWRLRDGDAHLFGTFAQTRERGEVLRHRYGAIKRIMLVASTGPRFGKVHVYLGRTRLTATPIDLAGYSVKAMRRIEVRSFGDVRQGVVRVVVVSKNRPVRIDGLGIASR